MSAMTSTGSLQARRSREATPTKEDNQGHTVFISPQRPTPKYTDPQRTSSSSFKPPMSRELIEKQIKKPESPPQPSTISSAFSYIKTVFTGRNSQNPTSVSSNASSTVKPPATNAMAKHLEVVKKTLSKVDGDENIGKDNNQEPKVTKAPAKALPKTPVRKGDNTGSPPPVPTILEENKIVSTVPDLKNDVKTEKPNRKKPAIPFSFDPKKIRPNANVKHIKDSRSEKDSMQYLPPTILPSRSNENEYDKQRYARMKKIEQFKTRHMVIPPTVLEPDTALNIVPTYQKIQSDFQSKEFIFPPTEIKTRINTASRSPAMTINKSSKTNDSNKGVNGKWARKSKSHREMSSRFAFASPKRSKPRPVVIPPTEEPKPYVQTTASGRTTSYRIVSSPPTNNTILRSSNFSPGIKRKNEKTKSPQKSDRQRLRSHSLTRQQVRSKSTPDRMLINSRFEQVTPKSKSALRAGGTTVSKISSHTSLDDDRDVPRKYTQIKNISPPRFEAPVKKSLSRDNQSPSAIRRSPSKDRRHIQSPSAIRRSPSKDRRHIQSPSAIRRSPSKDRRDIQSPSAIRRSSSKDRLSPGLARRPTFNDLQSPLTGQRSKSSNPQSPAIARRSMSHEAQSPSTVKNSTPSHQPNISHHRAPGRSLGKPRSPWHQQASKTLTNRKNSPPKSSGQYNSSKTGYSSVKKSPLRPFGNRSLGDSPQEKDKQKTPGYQFSNKRQVSPSKSLSSFQSSRHFSQPPMSSRSTYSNRQKSYDQKSKWAYKNQIISPKKSNSGNQANWKTKNKQSPKQQKKNWPNMAVPVIKSPSIVLDPARIVSPLRPSSPTRVSPAFFSSQESLFDPATDKENTILPSPQRSPKIIGSSHVVMTSPPHAIKTQERNSPERLSPRPEFQPQQPISEVEMSISPVILEALGGRHQRIKPGSINLASNSNIIMNKTTNPCQSPEKYPLAASKLQMGDMERNQSQEKMGDSPEPDFNNSSANLSNEINQYLQKIQTSWTPAPSSFVDEDRSNSSSSYIVNDQLFSTNDETGPHHISFMSNDLMIKLWDESDRSNSSLYNPSLRDDEQIFVGMTDGPTLSFSENSSDKILVNNEMFQDDSRRTSHSRNSISSVTMAGTSRNKHPEETNNPGTHQSAFKITKESITGTSVNPPLMQANSRTNSWQYDRGASFDREIRRGRDKDCPSCAPLKSKPITQPGKLSPNQVPLAFKNLKEVTPQGHSRQKLTYRSNKQSRNLIRKDIKFRSPPTNNSPVKYRDGGENFPPKQSQYAFHGRHAASSAVGAAFGSAGTRRPKSVTSKDSVQNQSTESDVTKTSTGRQSSPKEMINNTISFFSSMFKGKEKVPAELDNQEAKKIHQIKEQNSPRSEYSSDGLSHSTFQESLKKHRPIPSWRSSKDESHHEPHLVAQKSAVLSVTKKDQKPVIHAEKVPFIVKKDQNPVANLGPTPRYSGDPDDFTWSSTKMGETP